MMNVQQANLHHHTLYKIFLSNENVKSQKQVRKSVTLLEYVNNRDEVPSACVSV